MQLSELVPLVSGQLPGCPSMVIQQAARTQLRTLYRTYKLWQHRDMEATIGTDGTMSFTLPDDADVVEVLYCRTSDGAIESYSGQQTRFDALTSGTPRAIVEINGVHTVVPAPTEATVADVRLQLAPTRTASVVPDYLANKHLELYRQLVLAELMGQAEQVWTNPAGANQAATRTIALTHQAMREMDGWTKQRTGVVRYGGI